MSENYTPIAFTIGSRRIFAVPRRLDTVAFSLEDALCGRLPTMSFDGRDADGLRILSAPAGMVGSIAKAHPDHLLGGLESYRRHYIAMENGFDDYLARFSGKTRSTLRRKQRKFTRECGGELDVREYRTREEVARFLAQALPLSERTYQARLLDAGLPEDEASQTTMLDMAARDRMRCFLLWVDDRPVAYLSLPAEGRTLVYADLGYDPEWARLSPGTVLQMAALERLFAERRFAYFDFTEGDGAHKSLFGTNSVECSSFLLLRKGLSNRLLLGSLAAFDGGVAATKALAERSGALATVRRLLRA